MSSITMPFPRERLNKIIMTDATINLNIDFGIVEKYFAERGFGFLRPAFYFKNKKDLLFFHINSLYETYPDIAKKLENRELTETWFWYEQQDTSKGIQANPLNNPRVALQDNGDALTPLITGIEAIWNETNYHFPKWIETVTTDLLDTDRFLAIKKQRFEKIQRNHRERESGIQPREEKQRHEKKPQELQFTKIQKQQQYQEVLEKEFQLLVKEMSTLNFTHSKQVSLYIVKNKLGYKYKNISGVVQMEMNGDTWNFNGGFPPTVYARLCHELGLGNEGTKARAVGFQSYKDLEQQRMVDSIPK